MSMTHYLNNNYLNNYYLNNYYLNNYYLNNYYLNNYVEVSEVDYMPNAYGSIHYSIYIMKLCIN